MKPSVAPQGESNSGLQIVQRYGYGSSSIFYSQCLKLLVQSVGCVYAQHRSALYMAIGKSQIRPMPNLATWIRQKDDKSFRTIFAKHPGIKVWNARTRNVPLEKMDGLLLSGGSDISPEFLRQDVPDPSVLDKEIDPERDRWEFQAVQNALSRGLPILAICKGLQVFNVALNGTLKLDIKGHNLPHQKQRDIQPLRTARAASHQFPNVNSAHHQAVDRLGDNLEVEAWAADDGVIEQVRLRKYPFALGVQYHPERSRIYDSLFEDFLTRLESKEQ